MTKKSNSAKKPLSPDKRKELRDAWPPPHVWEHDATLWHMESDADGSLISETPICAAWTPLARAADEDGANASIVAKVAGISQPFHIPFSSFAGAPSKTIQEMSEAGLTVFPGAESQNMFLMLLRHAYTMALPTIRMTATPGFKLPDDAGHPSVFVKPDGRCIGKDGKTETRASIRDAKKNQVAGDWSASRDAFAACWESGLDHFKLAPMGGVLGTLRGFIDTPESAIIGLTGASTIGKTTTMRAIASAWGNPANAKGPMRSLKATDNAQELHLEAANHLVLCLDETKLFGGDLEALLFMIAEGVGKDRATATMRAKRTAAWSTTVFVSSERPIEELARETAKGKKVRVGLTVRCPDILVEKKALPEALVKRIKNARLHYGHLGPLFAQHLLDHETPEAIAERVEAKARTLADPSDLLQSRVAPIFAGLWECGEILQTRELGVIPASADVGAFIRGVWNRYLASETARRLSPEKSGLDALREALHLRMSRHGQNLNETVAPHGDVQFYFCPDDKADTITFHVPTKTLPDLLDSSASPHEVCAAALKADQLIARNDGKQLTHSYIPGVGAISHYRFKFTVPKSDADANAAQEATDEANKAEDAKREAAAEERARASAREAPKAKVSNVVELSASARRDRPGRRRAF